MVRILVNNTKTNCHYRSLDASFDPEIPLDVLNMIIDCLGAEIKFLADGSVT